MTGAGTGEVEGARVQPSRGGTLSRAFGLNELALATLMTLGFLALSGYVIAAAAFVWYAALYVLRT